MKKNFTLLVLALSFVFLTACQQPAPQNTVKTPKIQDIQVYTADNTDGIISPKSIEYSFDTLGLRFVSNKDMNKLFIQKFHKQDYKIYNLAIFTNNDFTLRLLEKYPKFALLSSLSMSIWEDKNGKISIATLSKHGIAKIAQIPLDDADLIAYTQLIKKALVASMPKGSFTKLKYSSRVYEKTSALTFSKYVKLNETQTYEEYIEDFENNFEDKMEAEQFRFSSYMNLEEEIFKDKKEEVKYDFFHTYSISNLDMVYSISKQYPELGAFVPNIYYVYKKSSENKMKIGFLDIDFMIHSFNIQDEEKLNILHAMQSKIIHITKGLL